MHVPRPEPKEEQGTQEEQKQEQEGWGGKNPCTSRASRQHWIKPFWCCLPKEQKPLLVCISKSSFISDIEFGPIAEQQRQRIVTGGIWSGKKSGIPAPPHPVLPPAPKPSNPQLHPLSFQPFQTHPFPCRRARPRACVGCKANPHRGHLAALELPPQPWRLVSWRWVTLNLLVTKMTMEWPSFNHKGDPQECVIPTLWRSRWEAIWCAKR